MKRVRDSNPDYPCVVCRKDVAEDDEAISCDSCDNWTHRICGTGMTRSRYLKLLRGSIEAEFICRDCSVESVDTENAPDNTGSSFVNEATFDMQFSFNHSSIIQSSTALEDSSTATTGDGFDVTQNSTTLEDSTADTIREETETTIHDPTQTTMRESFNVERSFDVPDENHDQERSLAEEPVADVTTRAEHTTYTIVVGGTKRGKDMLVDNKGYSYTLKKKKTNNSEWRCSVRRKNTQCPATVLQAGENFKRGRKDHIHPAAPGTQVAIQIKAEAKTNATQDVFTVSAPRIVDRAMRMLGDPDQPEASRPNPMYLIRAVNRVRQRLRPDDPRDLNFQLNEEYLEQQTPGLHYRDITAEPNYRHLLFYTDRQLHLLSQAKIWYMDGTFRVVNKPWRQLFTIHAMVRSGENTKQIPLIFCFMSGKRAEDYYQVLRALDHLLPERISLEGFVVDFESGMWKAIRDRFCGFPIHGCIFHWAQAVFRKIREKGLQVAYNRKDSVFKFLRRLMALPFLPHQHIEDTFHQLDRSTTPDLEPVMDYVFKTWLRNDVYPIKSWSVFGRSIRTNNDVEGWHNGLSTRVNLRGPVPFYLLICELFREADSIPMTLKLITEDKLQRQQRRSTLDLQGRIFDLWDAYGDREISTMTLLKECAKIYGPSVESE